MLILSKFKNASNQYYTNSLFLEGPKGMTPIVKWTLGAEDKDEVPSLQRLYFEQNDSSEVTFALKYFESWEHWELVRNCSLARAAIDKWQSTVIMKDKALAYARLKEMAEAGSLEANKIILNSIYEQGMPQGGSKKAPQASPRGRPPTDSANPSSVNYVAPKATPGSAAEERDLLDTLRTINKNYVPN